MKNPCKNCKETPKYQYGVRSSDGERFVALQCPFCQNTGPVTKSDPTALKYWNLENPR